MSSKNSSGDKFSWRRQFLFGLIATLIILLFPFLIFTHLLFDAERDSIIILGQILNHGYPDNQAFAWFVISDFVSLFYLSVALLLSFGFWRNFLIPAIIYFTTYPLWMFNDQYDRYFSFLSSFYGVITIVLTILIIKLLDNHIKQKLLTNYLSVSSSQIFREFFFSESLKLNKQILHTIKSRANLSLREYSCRLFYYSQFAKSNFRKHLTSNNIVSLGRSAKLNYCLGFFVLLITTFLLAHKAIPDDIQEIEFSGFQIGSFGFKDIGTLFYYVSQKFVICIIMIIWFITSQFWWRWAILSPIIFYSYQFWESFQPVDTVDASGNLNVFPLVFLTILGVFLLSKAIRRVFISLDYQAILEEELDRSIGELSKP